MTGPTPVPVTSYTLHERAAGGWWVMRAPEDRTGDTAGYVDGWAECLLSGVWQATSWDRETTTVARTLDGAAAALVALRWADDTSPAGDADRPVGGPTGLDPAADDAAEAAHLLRIVLGLAAVDPVLQSGDTPMCTLCDARPRGAAMTLAQSDHAAACPWAEARAYSTGLATDLRQARGL